MNTFVFAIGGSGARVLRSLTMLLASGCHNTAVNNPIIPIVIDYDTTNGDTLRSQEVMELYHELHTKAYQANDCILNPENRQNEPLKEHFFCTPLKMLREMCRPNQAMNLNQNSKYNLHLDAQTQTNITFAQYIGYNSLQQANGDFPTKQLLDSLYDTSSEYIPGTLSDNPKAELNMNLHKGFRGCPNLGCIVTQQLENSPEIILSVGSLIQPTDKIVIIGSVFGGTGASGIPMLLDLFAKHPNTAAAEKAVVAVMPYFSLTPPDANSSIDSNTFIAKAKAAIGAYEGTINNQAQCFYYIGDEAQNAFANHDGDRYQKNDAHYVELVSAMCVMDFITQTETGGFECGLDKWNQNGLNIEAFFKAETQDLYIHPMSRFKVFSTFCKNYLFTGKNKSRDIWLNGISQNGCKAIGDSSCKVYCANLKQFIDDFDTWIGEMADERTHRPLVLYNNTTDYKNVWAHAKLETSSLFGTKAAFDDDTICKFMTDNYNSLNARAQNGIPNRPEYLFWRGAKYTMDMIDNLLKNRNLI